MKSLTLSIQSYGFGQRLSWMLSSIYDASRLITYPIYIDIALVLDEPHKIKTYNVVKYFQRYLNIQFTNYHSAENIRFQMRGLTRNDAIERCLSDYILFLDTDLVFKPDHFLKLQELLDGEYKDCDTMMHIGRRSTYLEDMGFINDYNYPCYIPESFKISSALDSKKKSLVGAGYYHLASIDAINKKMSGKYARRAKDRPWAEYSQCKTDMYFRKTMKKTILPLDRCIHLQHVRSRDNRDNFNVQK